MTQSSVQDTILIQGIGDMAQLVDSIDYSVILSEFCFEIAGEKDAAFTNQTSPGGQPWAPLAESTKYKKESNVILVDTGALRTSLVDVGGTGNVNTVASHSLIYGTDVEYALFHESGTKRMPARPLAGLSETLVNKLADRIADMTAKVVGETEVSKINTTQ